ncbi:TPA: hypothetical protein ACFRHD_002155 [Neisseria lactamica]
MTKGWGNGENGGLAKRRASDGIGCFGGASECEACPQGTALPTRRQSATPTRKENQ